MKWPWEKAAPGVIIAILALLGGQIYLTQLRQKVEPGQLYLRTEPSGASINQPQVGSVSGYNLKFLAYSPGPLPISLKERTRFTFYIELAGFEPTRVYLTRSELAEVPNIELKPTQGTLSYIPYILRDYLCLWMVPLFGFTFYRFWIRPQELAKKVESSLRDISELKPGKKLHEYQLLKELGSGAAGTVFKAKKPGSEDLYTLKILHLRADRQDAEQAEYLAREFRNCSKLFHASIVLIQDWGVIHGHHYIVFDYVDGKALDREQTYSIADVCHWGSQVASGLAYAHSQGIVHRDIKPANLIVTPENRVRILDFGISGKTENGETSAAGTVGFMAPEQASGVVAQANDYYSLGITIYKLVSKQMPFEGDDYFQVLANQTQSKYVPLKERVEICPEVLSELVDKLLVLDPTERLTDCEEIQCYLSRAKDSLTSAAD